MLNQNAPRKFHIAGEHWVAQRMTGISSLMCPRMIPAFPGQHLARPPASSSVPSPLWSFMAVNSARRVRHSLLPKGSECVCVHAPSCLTLQASGLYSLPGSSVHGILQARILECVAISDRY